MYKANIWFCDLDGVCAEIEDMAKIGLLYLNKGISGGDQIVFASWIEEMTMPGIVEM